jgi:aarF domain-containing kinase
MILNLFKRPLLAGNAHWQRKFMSTIHPTVNTLNSQGEKVESAKSAFSRWRAQRANRKRLRPRLGLRRSMQVVGALGLVSAPVLFWFAYDEKGSYVMEAMNRSYIAGKAVVSIALDYKWTLRKGPEKLGEEEYEELKHKVHARSAQRLYDMARTNGGVFIKLGQHLSAMGYILPSEYVQAMKPLLDQCPRSTFQELDKLFMDDTGSGIYDWFSEFDSEPLGVASLAQVHRAVLKNGQEVAVKMQHPSLQRYAQIDMDTVSSLVKWIKRLFPQFEFTWLADEMHENLPLELNFQHEANNANRLRELFNDDPILHVPEVFEARQRILIMEFIRGARIDDVSYMRAHGIDPRQVSAQITDIFSRMIFKYGFLHADPHPANAKVIAKPGTFSTPNFELVLLDHGLYRILSPKFRFDYALLWSALIQRDEVRIEKQCNKLFDDARQEEWHRRVSRGEDLTFDQLVQEQEKVGNGPPSHKLFASILTGRAWNSLVEDEGVAAPRTEKELKDIANVAGTSEFFIDLAAVLAKVPRELLFLLKTNDLLRSLDEELGVGVSGRKLEGDAAGGVDISDHMMQTIARMGWHVARTVKQGRMAMIDDTLVQSGVDPTSMWSRLRYHVFSWKAFKVKWEYWKVTFRLVALDTWLVLRHAMDKLVNLAR